MKIRVFIIAGIISFILLISPAFSCNVPVFRYALERWPADLYEVVVFHKEPLSPEDTSVVEWLENSSIKIFPYANFTVQRVDLSSDISSSLLELWETLDEPELPCLALRYPGSTGFRQSIWSGGLTMDAAKKLVDSPLRQEIARKIIDGESAVWILLESGDRDSDERAAHILESQLSAVENTLTVPDPVAGNFSFTPGSIVRGAELRISFSMVRLSRKDPLESVFIAMLMHSEPDLFEYTSHPMAFPVFGRGRALYALIGNGITERNIRMACEFITGACSCEVKMLNPGVDILIAADWDAGIKESWMQDTELPPLIGLSELFQAVDTSDSADSRSISSVLTETADSASHKKLAYNKSHEISSQPVSPGMNNTAEAGDIGKRPATGGLLRNTLLALGIIVTVIVVLTLRVSVYKTENKR